MRTSDYCLDNMRVKIGYDEQAERNLMVCFSTAPHRAPHSTASEGAFLELVRWALVLDDVEGRTRFVDGARDSSESFYEVKGERKGSHVSCEEMHGCVVRAAERVEKLIYQEGDALDAAIGKVCQEIKQNVQKRVRSFGSSRRPPESWTASEEDRAVDAQENKKQKLSLLEGKVFAAVTRWNREDNESLLNTDDMQELAKEIRRAVASFPAAGGADGLNAKIVEALKDSVLEGLPPPSTEDRYTMLVGRIAGAVRTSLATESRGRMAG